MYPKKVPKSQEPDKSLYTIHHCHNTLDPIQWNTRADYYRTLSIDPGKKNFCFRIEMRNLVTKKIDVEVFEKIDLIGSQNSDRVTVDYINRNIIIILDKYMHLILNCNIVIIERQLSVNYKMVRFSQHIITYLMIRLMDNSLKTVILEIDSKLKTKQLGAPKKLGPKETKTWAIEKAMELLTLRNDNVSINIMNKAQKSKKDDLADTVVQIEAVFKLFGLLTTDGNKDCSSPTKISYGSTELFNPKYSTGLTLSLINPKINNIVSPPVKTQVTDISLINFDKIKLPVPLSNESVIETKNLTINLNAFK